MSVDHHLLEKYWAGLCSPAERKIVEQWMSEGIPEDPYELRSSIAEPVLKDQLWQRVVEARQEGKGLPLSSHIGQRLPWPRLVAIAAMLIIVIGVAVYISGNIFQVQSPAEASLVYQELVLPNGKKATVILPDGTKVHLNAGSRLRYPDKFKETERRIFLEGEAFFEVTKNPEKPFYVQTHNTATRVLGTRFNLRSWKGQTDILNVEEGRVQFTGLGCRDTLILHADMQGVFDGRSIKGSLIDSQNQVAWTKGIMVFNDLKLSEVAAELERWYAVQIHLGDPGLADYRVKARFDNPSLVDVLRDISFALNIKYNIKDKEVRLSR